MRLKTYFKVLFVHYFAIYGLTMLATLIICAASNPEIRLGLDYLWQSALFALAADVPTAVFISREELEGARLWLRIAIHAAILECVLMPIGQVIGMWHGVGGAFVFFFTVLAVDAIMLLINFLSAKFNSGVINARLKERDAERNSRAARERFDLAIEAGDDRGSGNTDKERS